MYYFFKSFTDPAAIILLLMIVGLLISKGIKKERPPKYGWWLLLVSFFLFYLLSIVPVVSGLSYMMEKEYLSYNLDNSSEVDVIVVLGGGIMERGLQSGYDPSKNTSSRLLFGLQALNHSNARHIVLSGRGWGKISEAAVMAGISRRLGIDESRIIIEPRSENTWEHGVELDKLFESKEISIGIVTSATHMKRSIKVFSRYFPNVVPLPSSFLYSPLKLRLKSLVPRSEAFSKSSIILHEIIGNLWYCVRA